MNNLNPSLKKAARGISLFLLIIFINFNLCAQSSATEKTTGDKLVAALLIIVALAFISLIIYSVVQATKGEAVFYCGMGDYIIAMLPLILLVIGIGILEWKPIFSIIIIACALFYNLFMSFSLNSGKTLNQFVIFMGRMTVGYLSIALLLIGLLMLITMLFGGPGKKSDETYLEHRARKARYTATGAGFTVGGALLIRKLINSQPGDLTENQRNFTVIGKAVAFVLMAGCFGGWYFIDNSKVVPVQAAEVNQVSEAISSGNYNSTSSQSQELSASEESNRIAEENKQIEEKNRRIEEETRLGEAEAFKQKEESDALQLKTFFGNGIDKAKRDFSINIVSLNNSYIFLSDGSTSGTFYIIQAKNMEMKTKAVIPQDTIIKEPGIYKIEHSSNSIWDGEVAFNFKQFRKKQIPKKFIEYGRGENNEKVYYVKASKKIYKYINVLPWSSWEEGDSGSEFSIIKYYFSGTNGMQDLIGFEDRSLSKAGIEADKLDLTGSEIDDETQSIALQNNNFSENIAAPSTGVAFEKPVSESINSKGSYQEKTSGDYEQTQETTEQAIPIENEQRPTKIKNVEPIYPPVALKFQVQGVVSVEVETDSKGKVIQARVISGPPLLHNAALVAVKQWIYKPYILDGKTKPVIFTDTVGFSLKK